MGWVNCRVNGEFSRIRLHPETTLGRDLTCTVQVLDKLVSNRHCRIVLEGDGWWVEDLGSLNGTLLGKEPVVGLRRLRDGDVISIGSISFTFTVGPPADDAEPPPDVARLKVEPQAGAPIAFAPPPLEPSPQDAAAQPMAPESGLLVVERGGDMHVRLWNVAVGQGGYVVRIPLVGERPPSSRLLVFRGKGRREVLTFDEADPDYAVLLETARLETTGLTEPLKVRYLTGLVFRALGERLDDAQIDACRRACAPYAERPMPLGNLIRLGVGLCRHRAFLFFHLGRALGLRVGLFRGFAMDSRHAWNEVQIGRERVFVDASLGLVMEGALEAERSFGLAPSRFLTRREPDPAAGRSLVLGDEGEAPVRLPAFRHEIRKVPGDEEAVLLIYPEADLPEVRFLHLHLRGGDETASLFAIPAPRLSRVFAIVGDEAVHLHDAVS